MVKQKKTYTVDDLVAFPNNPLDEQETSIVFERNGDKMTIWTSDNTIVTKLRGLMTKSPEEYILRSISTYDGQPVAYEVEAPKEFLSLRSVRVTRTMTEEQRIANSERMKAMRAAQKAAAAAK
jgi:hypothetical protein